MMMKTFVSDAHPAHARPAYASAQGVAPAVAVAFTSP